MHLHTFVCDKTAKFGSAGSALAEKIINKFSNFSPPANIFPFALALYPCYVEYIRYCGLELKLPYEF